MTKQEILELIKEAKELGLKSIKIGDIAVEFNSVEESTPKKGYITPQQELEADDLVKPISPLDELSFEEILFWSSDYGIELEQAKIRDNMDAAQRKAEDADRKIL